MLRKLAVSVTTKPGTVRTHLTMEIAGPARERVEAVLRLAVPRGAAVTGAILWVNGRPMNGAFVQRERARQIYRSIVDRRRDPALVTWDGPGWVSVSIFPLEQGEPRRFELEWIEPAATEAGVVQYRVPTIVDAGRVLGRPSVEVDGHALATAGHDVVALAAAPGGHPSDRCGAGARRPVSSSAGSNHARRGLRAGPDGGGDLGGNDRRRPRPPACRARGRARRPARDVEGDPARRRLGGVGPRRRGRPPGRPEGPRQARRHRFRGRPAPPARAGRRSRARPPAHRHRGAPGGARPRRLQRRRRPRSAQAAARRRRSALRRDDERRPSGAGRRSRPDRRRGAAGSDAGRRARGPRRRAERASLPRPRWWRAASTGARSRP